MIDLHPIKLSGDWHEGFALDIHTISSTLIGYDQYGHEVFDSQRSPIGELLYRLKYRRDRTVLDEITEAAANFITNEWKIRIEAVVPVPPSKSNRSLQPVIEVAKGISTRLQMPYSEAIVKVTDTPELKNVFDYKRRQELLREAFGIKNLELIGKDILLFDDLFRSGATLNAITRVLYDSGMVNRIYALTLTKTRSKS
ncbi:MAG: ComF family protein [Pyrinomonadaceae bacterium]|nr:ComF family protein [Pyrinomonadaceae bacterium]